jgi:colicin import membrane protein
MPGFAREHLRPLIGSAALHVLLVAALVAAAFHWRSQPAPVPLAIEGTVIQYKDLPRSLRAPAARRDATPPSRPPAAAPEPTPAPKSEAKPEPKPEPQPEPQPEPKPKPKPERKVAPTPPPKPLDDAKTKAAAADARRRQEVAEADAKRQATEEARLQKEAKAQAARDAKLKADREAELKRALAAEEEGAAIAQSGVTDEYRALLVQAIERNWIRPPSARAGLECTLNVTQATGGTVVDVKVGDCNGDQAVRESIANAVYRSSPLPAPRDPRAFERHLVIVFKPTE